MMIFLKESKLKPLVIFVYAIVLVMVAAGIRFIIADDTITSNLGAILLLGGLTFGVNALILYILIFLQHKSHLLTKV